MPDEIIIDPYVVTDSGSEVKMNMMNDTYSNTSGSGTCSCNAEKND